ncbi:MAG: hypothetical protein ACLFS9_03945 [Nitriliruptoraceae bacterium]
MSRIEVVTHVHWDREWYRTFEGFRARLVELVDAVLDQLESGQLPAFLLDGQTSVVDDYLAVRPGQADRVAAHVAAGRLRIGPWYVLADMTLVSTEALIRNLAWGTRRAAELGGRTDVGYCPDMFGHPPELPTLLTGFGITSALVWRGADPAVPVFRWRAPDGAEVTTLRSRYYEPEVLWEPAGATERLEGWLADRRAELPEGPWLLLNGGDHLAPRDLRDRLAQLPQEPPVVPTSLEEHLARLDRPDLPTVTGALRRPGVGGAFLLAGVLSIRPELKRTNAAAQALLEGLAEPLVAQALATVPPHGQATELPGDTTLRGLLETAWKQVLLGHPHDSVCGCATDQVAADTLRRYQRGQEVGHQVVERAAARLGLPVAHRAISSDLPAPELGATEPGRVHLAVLNPLGSPRGGSIDLEVLLDAEHEPQRVRTRDGAWLPLEATPGPVSDDMVTDIATPPRWGRLRRWRVRSVVPEVPASGWSCLVLEVGQREVTPGGGTDTPTPPRPASGVSVDRGQRIGNQRFEVEVEPTGTLSVTDRATGRRLGGLARLRDGGERGDTYNHDAPREDELVDLELVEVERRRSEVGEELHLSLAAELPARLDGPARDRRSAERVPCTAALTVRLTPGADTIELDVQVDTVAEDHRLRLHLPTGTDEAGFDTDAGIAWQRHAVPSASPALPREQGAEADPATQPAHRFVATGTGPQRVAALLSGLHEVAAQRTPTGVELVVTLLRAVGQLGYHDLRTRTMGAGPPVATPAAQAPGAHRFRLGLRFGDDDATLTTAAWGWRTPLHTLVLSGEPAQPVHHGIEVAGAQLSAWLPAQDGVGWIVRIANPTTRTVAATVRLPVAAQVTRVRLDETPVPGADGSPEPPRWLATGTPLSAELAPAGLVTWRVVPDGA